MRTAIIILMAALAAIIIIWPVKTTFKQRWQPAIDHPLHQRGSLANLFCHWYIARCAKV